MRHIQKKHISIGHAIVYGILVFLTTLSIYMLFVSRSDCQGEISGILILPIPILLISILGVIFMLYYESYHNAYKQNFVRAASKGAFITSLILLILLVIKISKGENYYSYTVFVFFFIYFLPGFLLFFRQSIFPFILASIFFFVGSISARFIEPSNQCYPYIFSQNSEFFVFFLSSSLLVFFIISLWEMIYEG